MNNLQFWSYVESVGVICFDSNTKTCYPSTLPIYLVDLSVEEQSVVSSLSSCLQCTVIADQRYSPLQQRTMVVLASP